MTSRLYWLPAAVAVAAVMAGGWVAGWRALLWVLEFGPWAGPAAGAVILAATLTAERWQRARMPPDGPGNAL